MTKTLLLMLPIASLATVFSGAAAPQAPPLRGAPQVAFVSSQRVFAETTAGKADLARLQALQLQKNTELRTRQQTLDALRQQLAQATDNDARNALQRQELQQRTDLERGTAQAQTELQNLQRQSQTEVLAAVRAAIDDLAKTQNFQIVLNADTSVVWAAPGLDLTPAVVERLNAASPAAAPK